MENSLVTINVLNNDSDPQGQSLSIISHTNGSSGSVTPLGINSFSYTPDPSTYGVDTFTYTIEDNGGHQAVATVQVNVMTPHTWHGGGGDNLWSNPANWCGTLVNNICPGGPPPNNAQKAVFSPSCTSGCDVMMDTPIDIAGLHILSGFGSNMNQNNQSIIIGNEKWTQEGGSFIGSNLGSLTLNGNSSAFSLTGGSFTAPRLTMSLTSSVGAVPNPYLLISDPATFSHNQGTVEIAQTGGGSNCSSNPRVLNVENTAAFHKLRFDADSGFGGCLYNLSGKIPTVEDHLYFNNSKIQGEINLHGNIAHGNQAWNGNSSGTIHMIGVNDQEYSGLSTGGMVPTLHVNKPSGDVIPAAGATYFSLSGLIIEDGNFIAPSGDLKFTFTSLSCFGTSTLFSVDNPINGDFFHSNGTIVLTGNGQGGSCGGKYILDLPSGTPLNNVRTAQGSLYYEVVYYPGADPVRIEGNFDHQRSHFYGNWELMGNLNLGDNTSSGSSEIKFIGGATQTVSFAPGFSPASFGLFTVDKTAGQVTQSSDVALNGLGQDMVITDGIWNMNGFDLDVESTLSLDFVSSTVNRNGGIFTINSAPATDGTGNYGPGTINP
jgi:hypothetical protein